MYVLLAHSPRLLVSRGGTSTIQEAALDAMYEMIENDKLMSLAVIYLGALSSPPTRLLGAVKYGLVPGIGQSCCWL